MSEKEQITRLADEIDNIIEHFRDEYNMAFASVVGVLQMKILLVCREAEQKDDP